MKPLGALRRKIMAVMLSEQMACSACGEPRGVKEAVTA